VGLIKDADKGRGRNNTMDALFHADGLEIRPISEDDLVSTLEVYKQVENFLSLGPIPTASMKMVIADIAHSREEKGIYCGIWNHSGNQIGILDFSIGTGKDATLSLLMISKQYQNQGNGRRIVQNLESYLKEKYGVEAIHSGVQVNNEGGITFWKKMGFIISNRPRNMGDGTVAYEMTKSI
jgi:ribosomal protein S18 acetylase RimI-like enzyme